MLPTARNPRAGHSKLPRLPGKSVQIENTKPEKDDVSQTKRSPSSPQGAPKKRSAFGDITNAHKNPVPHLKKKDGVKVTSKKAQRNNAPQGVSKNNEINLKKSIKKPSIEETTGKEDTVAKEAKGEPIEKPIPVEEQKAEEPVPEIDDIDKDNDDPCVSSLYAMDIFNYMKQREEKFVMPNYLLKQHDISKDMRAILIDWMVEVQENFELNHETLYLAVKLVDHYLAVAISMREKLQLIGSTAILISSKFEERCPPCVDDFLYICDDAYKREEIISMEMEILRRLDFDINIPISYRFLRRFAKCAHANMETLTLARFICELTLQEYDYIQESASKLAASCLLLALCMKNLGSWTPTLSHYSGYKAADLIPLVKRLNCLLTYQKDEKLKAVRNKYTHKVFFEVAKMPPLDILSLEDALKS
ncbi:G2/mitotic-specific cyclin-B3 [Ambystoma mexicanum]|uniref:G2/mitotic-specific cyclin-B3 n=1 Tax=Ambystoma mexicanum TaxID=8296 RepID=UPI0037E880AA